MGFEGLEAGVAGRDEGECENEFGIGLAGDSGSQANESDVGELRTEGAEDWEDESAGEFEDDSGGDSDSDESAGEYGSELGDPESDVDEPRAEGDEDWGEELEGLPEEEKLRDPLHAARIMRTVDGVTFTGHVEDIEFGTISRSRLYFIRYSNGDEEHTTAREVLTYLC